MKRFLKRDSSVQQICYTVFDELGNELYYAVNDSPYNFHNYEISDLNNNKLCTVHCLPLPVFYAYNIFDGKDRIKLIFNKNPSIPLISFFGISWRFSGDVLTKNYEIIDTDNTVLLSHRCCWTGGIDSYEIEIFDEPREILLLASTICIDKIQTADSKLLQTV